MIHMRPYSDFECENVKFLVDLQIEFTTIQITETGLKKSILDATHPVRNYLKEKGIHDYNLQLQGTDHKKIISTYVLTESSCYQTQTSLYRPITKKGDPRLWVNKIKGIEFFHANDIFAIIAYDERLYVINLTTTNISKAYNSIVITPLKDFIAKLTTIKNKVSDELLGLIKDRMTDWVPAEVNADTGVGRTIETVLGIPMNASKAPDYKGIEIKSHREETKVRGTLFTQAPDWSISRYKSGKQIVDAYGYIPQGDTIKTLRVTLTAHRPNPQKLGLFLNDGEEILEVDEFCLQPTTTGTFLKIQDVAAWKLQILHERLLTKHHETFWIDVQTKREGGKEYFKCSTIEHTMNPLVHQFDILLNLGSITVDLLLCRPKGRGDTYSFKIKKKDLPLLFPEPKQYILI